MARRTSASHVSWCLAALLGSGLAQASAQAPPDDLSGTWGSNIGVTYTITQSVTEITWVDIGATARYLFGFCLALGERRWTRLILFSVVIPVAHTSSSIERSTFRSRAVCSASGGVRV